MSTGKTIGLFVVGLLLFATVGAANVTYTLDRTMLDADYVSDTAEDEGVYATVADDVTGSIEGDLEDVDPAASRELPPEVEVEEFEPGEIADGAVTEGYVANQSETALRSLYAYLHGDTDDLELVIDTGPLKENAKDAIADRAASVNASDMIESVNTEQMIRESAEQANANEVPDDRIQPARLFDSESSFNDEVALVRRAPQSELDRFEETAKETIRTGTPKETSQYPQNVTDATVEMQITLVEAYTTGMSYDEFTTRMEASEDELAAEAGRLALQQLDEEVDDQIALSELLNDDQQGSLEEQVDEAAGPVQQNDTARTVLPIVALLLIVIAYALSRSIHTTAQVTGVAFAVSGIGGFIGATIAGSVVTDQLRGAVPEDSPQQVIETVLALIDGMLGTLASQSLVLGAVGLLLVGLVYADQQGYLDGL